MELECFCIAVASIYICQYYKLPTILLRSEPSLVHELSMQDAATRLPPAACR